MTRTEQAMTDLRTAVRDDLIEQLKHWWTASKDDYTDPGDAIEDAILVLEER